MWGREKSLFSGSGTVISFPSHIALLAGRSDQDFESMTKPVAIVILQRVLRSEQPVSGRTRGALVDARSLGERQLAPADPR